MKKNSKRFICKNCGESFLRWAGKCESCETWNSIEEVVTTEKFSVQQNKKIHYKSPTKLSEIDEKNEARLSTGIQDLDLVLGGGIVLGSLTLIGGEPGVGKSTLVLSIARSIDLNKKILYISGEESSSQILLRAKRMKLVNKNLFLSSETNVDIITQMILAEKPDIVFIDSIQTIQKKELGNTQGTVTQLRECTIGLLETAKSSEIPIFLIGHITKEGSIAGPKVLEHLVDTVLYFESDKLNYYRIIRGIKNRFGPVGDIAVFEMKTDGLVEIQNRSQIFLNTGIGTRIGSVVACKLEGTRGIAVEVQALVTRSSFGQARRMTEGLDNRRLIFISAVIEKFLGMKLSEFDIFSNLAGGLFTDEPALDLSIAVSILSSYYEKPIPEKIALMGEIGLSGEIRTISHANIRVKELINLDMEKIYLPIGNIKDIESEFEKNIFVPIDSIQELVKIF
ncbi:MAG: DNA repair protein RadA [Leptospiraceae bacterium]|nr:DNA repair protein RadA [Leptospiraceae bacterium]